MANHRVELFSSSDEVIHRNGAPLTADLLTAELQLRSEDLEEGELDEELLPNIPNNITLNVIAPKFSWKDFYVLSVLPTVSRAWAKAIQGRLVHNARVRTHSVERLAVVGHQGTEPGTQKMLLYSTRDNSWYPLPPIPGVPNGFPLYCQCVSLNGKIYVLGGGEEFMGYVRNSMKVFVLDLVGQRKWKQCTSMPRSMQDLRTDYSESRSHSSVIDGKIYCFGSSASLRRALKPEVYDPETDTWSMAQPMVSTRINQRVTTMGNELFMQGGVDAFGRERFSLIEAYDHLQDEWRLVEPLPEDRMGAVFVAEGKLHAITELGMYVHDVDKPYWTLLHSHSFPEFEQLNYYTVQPRAVIQMDDHELLLLVKSKSFHPGYRSYSKSGSYLFRSRGFGDKCRQIVWDRIKCPCLREGCPSCGYNTSFLVSVQL